MLEFLPPRIGGCLRYLNLNRLYELRMRADRPLRILYGEQFVYLGEEGICTREHAVRPTREEVESALYAACDFSLYAVENQLRGGFVTTQEGVRLGIAGTFVYENGSVHTVRDFTSLCIRIPHEIRGSAREIYEACLAGGVRSVLILGPPGEGKTTLLRDLCRMLCERTACNVLVCDERGELSAGSLGDTADIVRYADKRTAFTVGIRALRPEVLVTDELLPEDYDAVVRAVSYGVSVIASAHLCRYEAMPCALFERSVFLKGLGKTAQILDREGNRVD